MRKSYKLFNFLTFLTFALFVIMFSPRQALAASLNDVFSSPDSLIVKIQERIEYFFAFKTEQKIIVLEKQAERRLTRAENLIKTKDVNQIPSLIKSYESLKEKQGNLIRSASLMVLTGSKERTVEQQARIEDMKEGMPDDAKETIEDDQRTVIKTMIENSVAKEGEDKANEFAEEVKNVLAPGSNVLEVAPGTLEVAPGTLEVAP